MNHLQVWLGISSVPDGGNVHVLGFLTRRLVSYNTWYLVPEAEITEHIWLRLEHPQARGLFVAQGMQTKSISGLKIKVLNQI